MRREDVTQAVLAAADGRSYTPVQIQKALFLLSKEMPSLFDVGSTYDFRPYDYGPFDKNVYADISALAQRGLADVLGSAGGLRVYIATAAGRAEGAKLLAALKPAEREYVTTVSEFVRNNSFSKLVTAIYKKYPDMKVNSVFVGNG